jgi:toxin ParE1/3/4
MPLLGGEWLTGRAAYTGLRFWTLREFPMYVVIYRPLPDGVEILRVVHGARDLGRLLDALP